MYILASGYYIDFYEGHVKYNNKDFTYSDNKMTAEISEEVINKDDASIDNTMEHPICEDYSSLNLDSKNSSYYEQLNYITDSELSYLSEYNKNAPIVNLCQVPYLTSSVSTNFAEELSRLNLTQETNGFEYASDLFIYEQNNNIMTDNLDQESSGIQGVSVNSDSDSNYNSNYNDRELGTDFSYLESVSVNNNVKEHKLEVIDGITYIDGIMIVNKTYSLPEDYNPGGILPEVKEAFSIMQSDAAQEGLKIYISSGYRSYKRQAYLHEKYIKRDGEEKADTYSARAGYSEHQTGLCIDLNSISDSFSNTPESKWVSEHAHEYGFIVRFPEGKEELTGYKYESWHLRYIGIDKATEVYNSGLCLEEFLGISSVYVD